MEDIGEYFKELLSYIPKEVALAVVLVCILTEITKVALAVLETILEAKYQKEIVFFDHTKIVLVIFWSLLFSIILAVAKVLTWQIMPLYFFGIMGTSTFFYELIIKKLKKLWD